MRTILFVFGGRRDNLEIAIPYYRRILDLHPEVEVHLWDLARDPEDHEYMQSLPTSERFQVRTKFYEGTGRASRGQKKTWQHYTRREYQDAVFCKLDDDVTFLQTDQFGDFIQAAEDNPTSVISALTINNGASTRHIPDLWAMYETLDIPLLDVHMSADYAEQSHRWFFNNWQTLTNQPTELIPTEDWVSINAIAYTWRMGVKIAQRIGLHSPRTIAGRTFSPHRNRIGDEGSVNMFPRLIHTGFVAGHLTFGPQHMTVELLDELRQGYALIAGQYLDDGKPRRTVGTFADGFLGDLEPA